MQRKDSIGKEATSKETLEDLEENEVDVDEDESSDADSPSPDGAFDDGDELNEADPL
jgi:hypothetical protein